MAILKLSTGLVLLVLCWLFIVQGQEFVNRRVWKEVDGVIWPKKEHKGTVFFLHNVGEFGVSVKYWLNMILWQFPFDHLKLIFPNAPLTYYGPLMGVERYVWFDEQGIGPQYKENLNDTYDISYHGLEYLIWQEESNYNLSRNKIIVGGFGQGGAMALHVGYRMFPDLAGIFSLSSYLADDSIVYKDLVNNTKPLPPLYFVNGAKDTVVKPEWGRRTFDRLQKLGVQGQYVLDKNVSNELKLNELMLLRKWIKTLLGAD